MNDKDLLYNSPGLYLITLQRDDRHILCLTKEDIEGMNNHLILYKPDQGGDIDYRAFMAYYYLIVKEGFDKMLAEGEGWYLLNKIGSTSSKGYNNESVYDVNKL